MYRIIVDIFRNEKAEAVLKHSFRFSFLFFIFGNRQSENKLCANALCTDTVDIFSMSLNDFFYNGKSKTGAALVFSAGEVGFVKSFPDFFQTVFGNTDSGILDRDKYFVVLLGCLNRDRGIRMTELDRIVDQIVKYLLILLKSAVTNNCSPERIRLKRICLLAQIPSKVRSVVLIVWLISKSVTSSITP